jgi:UDP-N-acetylmuramoyl-tripeptide--D-alanyl-D-alanine ligase
MLMSLSEAARALSCAGAYIPPEKDTGFSSVSIDSRSLSPGALFVALSGENTDGHRFLHDVFARGAAGALVERQKLGGSGLEALARSHGVALLPVENTLSGLQQLAAAYLDRFPRLLRIGITGSSGKTTTKEIARAICRLEKEVIANAGNLNSETGLPLSVFEVRSRHEIGIFEAGMNRPDEIGELAHVLRPHIALITNVGSAHIGCFGSRRAIAREKKAIFSAFTGSQRALIPAADEFSSFLAQDIRGSASFFGKEDVQKTRALGLYGWEIDWEGKTARFPLPGRHNLENALAAAALARAAGISPAAIRAGFEASAALFGRGEIFERAGVTILRDCYNANPESAAAALAFCDELDWPGRRLYVIGAMLELGGASEAAHRALGSQLARSKADAVFLYGAETACAVEAACATGKPVFYTDDMDALRASLAHYLSPGALALLKGSRGCALERALSGNFTSGR